MTKEEIEKRDKIIQEIDQLLIVVRYHGRKEKNKHLNTTEIDGEKFYTRSPVISEMQLSRSLERFAEMEMGLERLKRMI